jgi:flavorubredoxin
VVRTSLTELVRRYGDWTADQVAAASAASVAVLYASAYGNTAALAQALSRGITKAGVGVETLNLEVVGVDEVDRVLSSAAGFVIGSPTLGGHMPTQVATALGAVLRAPAAKALPCGVFGSFGWSGEAVDLMEGRLKVRRAAGGGGGGGALAFAKPGAVASGEGGSPLREGYRER